MLDKMITQMTPHEIFRLHFLFLFPLKLDLLGSHPLNKDNDDRTFIPLVSLLKFHCGTNQVNPEFFRIPSTIFSDWWPFLLLFLFYP
jgi:hypothetical protein